MRRLTAFSVALLPLLALVACASGTPTPAKEAGPIASASPSADAPREAPVLAEVSADPRVVRCGVDDRPKNVVGSREPVDFFPAAGPRLAASPLVAQSFGHPSPSKMVMAKPRPPSIRTVALARPRSSAFFESATRGGSQVDEATKTAAIGRRFDVSECIGEADMAKGAIVIQLRVASSGAPLEARPKSTELDDRMTHCVVELGCQLTLPAGAPPGDLEIRAALSQVQPVFKGSVSVSPSSEGPYSEAMQPALTKVGQAIKPLAEECAKKTPPASSVSFQHRLAIDDRGLLVLTPPVVGGATEALLRCIAPRLTEGVGPVPPALRKAGALRTSFSFVVTPS